MIKHKNFFIALCISLAISAPNLNAMGCNYIQAPSAKRIIGFSLAVSGLTIAGIQLFNNRKNLDARYDRFQTEHPRAAKTIHYGFQGVKYLAAASSLTGVAGLAYLGYRMLDANLFPA